MADPAPWSVDALKQSVLVGIPQSFKGQAFPEFLYTNALAEAQAWLHSRLHIDIPVQDFTERLDFRQGDLQRWFLTPLNHKPVVSVTRLTFTFNDIEIIEVPPAWVMVPNPSSGFVQVVPTVATLVVFAGTELALRYFNSRYAQVPGWYKVEYRAGMDPATMPADLISLGYKRAALMVLQQAANLVTGTPGSTNRSISMDGLSTNVAAPSPFQMQIKMFQQMIDDDAKRLYGRLVGPQFRVV